jgi:hypothetical protein
MTGEWRKVHNVEPNDVACSACVGMRVVYKSLVGKLEGKGPLGRPRHRWEDKIKLGPQELGLGGVDWIEVAQDRDRWRALVTAEVNLRVR